MFKSHTASVCPVNTPPTVRESKEREMLQTRLILKSYYVRLGNGSWFAVLHYSHSKYGRETQIKTLFYLFVRLYANLCTVHGH